MSERQTTAQVAKLLGISEGTLRMWVHRGHLKLTAVSRGRNAPWSEEAIAEARAWQERPRRGRKRAVCVRPLSARSTLNQDERHG